MQFSSNGPIRCCIPLNLLELVVAGKNVQFFRKLRLFELEPGGSHLYTQPFGFSTPGNNAAIVVTENDDRFAAQIRPENLLAALLQIVGGDKLIIPFC